MLDKIDLASKLYNNWETIQDYQRPRPKCFVGFDGFTDEIIQAVDKRINLHDFVPFLKIADFGKRIVDAAGKSCNIELVVQRKKLGGNAPIMTNALLSGGHEITFAGAIGSAGNIEPLFQGMADGCKRVIPLGPSGHSDALEFEDGKVILGKLDALTHINYHSLLAQINLDELTHALDTTDLFVCANWTMLPMMNDLWRHLLKEVIPNFKHNHPRTLFVDLADPAKRTDEDLQTALTLLPELGASFKIILGLNEAEAVRIINILTEGAKSIWDIQQVPQAIQSYSDLDMIVVHTTQFAMAATAEASYRVDGPYTPRPKMTTGAGDNFNAGFCTALLYGLTPEECLLTGVSTSGYYVRKALSPTIPELAAFLNEWSQVGDAQLID